MKKTTKRKHFALRIDNTDYPASLVPGKIYRLLKDAKASKDDLIRIVDESGEDYPSHKSLFLIVDLPDTLAKKLIAIEKTA
ncbi:MAG TPA: hypothetical protein VMR20_06510 [Verrucomicrobiae bacterium]|nr:hypothetical protein [Verrucomicrobiae bacterium]